MWQKIGVKWNDKNAIKFGYLACDIITRSLLLPLSIYAFYIRMGYDVASKVGFLRIS